MTVIEALSARIPTRAVKFALLLALHASLVLSLAACGQRGPLYLPDEPAPYANGQPPIADDEAQDDSDADADEDQVHSGSFEDGSPG